MNRFDRALSILLLLRSGKTWAAPELARRMGVSVRTIYRDIDTLGEVGVPVYAEAGREGGYRLVEGYFLPPVAFTVGEATSLLTGLALLARLRARPFAAELDTAAHKLLAAVPDPLRDVLAHVQEVIGFEAIPEDLFHPELSRDPGDETEGARKEAHAITVFLRCIFEKQPVTITYHSPYSSGPEAPQTVTPCGILWDRDRWYLIGRQPFGGDDPRLWRADRVLAISAAEGQTATQQAFSIDQALNRRWLDSAMSRWASDMPVVVRMTPEQAGRLRKDWYYGHARFEDEPEGTVRMTFGESRSEFVFEMLRWLGPGAELIEPGAWRDAFTADLRTMLAIYER
jgi:predicted DNA-binding transcriptional regulator YafY